MIDKELPTPDDAVRDIADGATILVGGFGGSGSPAALLEALARRRLRNLTVVSNNAGTGRTGLAALLLAGSVKRLCCSYPISSDSVVFEELYTSGEIELELIAQGTLSERIRAAGAGIGGFYTRTGYGTILTEERESRSFAGEQYVLELPLPGDVALIAARAADPWGNLVYNKAGRNFGPTMAAAADVTIAQVENIVALGELSPEEIITPGVFVDRVVKA